MRIVLSVIGTVLLCGQVAADAIDLSLNGDAFRVQYLRQLRANNLNLDAGWLHNSDTGDVAHIGLHLAGLASEGGNPVRAGLGGWIRSSARWLPALFAEKMESHISYGRSLFCAERVEYR